MALEPVWSKAIAPVKIEVGHCDAARSAASTVFMSNGCMRLTAAALPSPLGMPGDRV